MTTITGYRAMVIIDGLTESEFCARRDTILARYVASGRSLQSLTPSDVGWMVAEDVERETRETTGDEP